MAHVPRQRSRVELVDVWILIRVIPSVRVWTAGSTDFRGAYFGSIRGILQGTLRYGLVGSNLVFVAHTEGESNLFSFAETPCCFSDRKVWLRSRYCFSFFMKPRHMWSLLL